MVTAKWKSLPKWREVKEVSWVKVKIAYEKLKEETNAKDEHIQ